MEVPPEPAVALAANGPAQHCIAWDSAAQSRVKVGECLHPVEGWRRAPGGEGAGAEVFDGLGLTIGFHGSFEVLDQALSATGVTKGPAVFSVGKCRGEEDLLYSAYVVGLDGWEVALKVGKCCIKLSVAYIFDVALL